MARYLLPDLLLQNQCPVDIDLAFFPLQLSVLQRRFSKRPEINFQVSSVAFFLKFHFF